ncbi:Uncharacterized conserved protein [Phaffia rhodozyma]|uniref:Phosphatidate cytidylyltransferase, mitochondrial n=1 Tax=Phaffia rhodozyma TaxID=264483 RepID=A0A0F7SSZ8_PHARH|nr:Uncharacterized conserved protein [Phaffia rhodozyma]
MYEEEDVPQLSVVERVALVSNLIRQAPPGEINDVINDARLLLQDDKAFDEAVGPAVKSYNHDQFVAFDVPGLSYKTLVAPAALVPGEPSRYYEPRSGQSFEFDHISLTASDLQPLDLPKDTTSFIASFEKPLQTYISNHYSNGAGCIFPSLVLNEPVPDPTPIPATSAPESTPVLESTPEFQIPSSSQEASEKVEDILDGQNDKAEVTEEAEPGLVETLKDAVVSGVKSVLETSGVGEEVSESVDPEEPEATKEVKEEKAEEKEEVKEEQQVNQEEETNTTDVADEGPDVPVAALDKEESSAVPVKIVPAGRSVGVDEGKFTIVTSGHRYSPTNFWTGRWRSSYDIDLKKESFIGQIQAVVHYYEQGNVQLRTVQTPTIALPPVGPSQAAAIISEISKVERLSQEGANERLEELGDKTFKSLRRALPVTRQKVDWDKVSGYKLGGAIGVLLDQLEIQASFVARKHTQALPSDFFWGYFLALDLLSLTIPLLQQNRNSFETQPEPHLQCRAQLENPAPMVSLPDSTLTVLSSIVGSFRAPIRYAFAYGSGIFPQSNGSPGTASMDSNIQVEGTAEARKSTEKKPMLDFVFATTHPDHFHSINMQQNPSHYPAYMRLLGSNAVTWLQEKGGAGVWYNAYVEVEGVTIKYGVISVDKLCEDLINWDTLYCSGRMHKPIRIIRNDPRVKLAHQVNLCSALRVALLTLPEKFEKRELFERIAGLSYGGDPRMMIPGAENPRKVVNIVEAQMDRFQGIYGRLLVELGSLAVSGSSGDVLQQDTSPEHRASLARKLPKVLKQAIRTKYASQPRESSSTEEEKQLWLKIGGDETLAAELLKQTSQITRYPALLQSIKGIITAGPMKSLAYSLAKIGKYSVGKKQLDGLASSPSSPSSPSTKDEKSS